MKTTYQTGIAGEQTAAAWLQKHMGMRMLESRYRNQAGEIDLIMMDRDTIVFIEVKTRLHAPPGHGLLAVDQREQQRIARSAVLYLTSKGWLNRPVRFDATEVRGSDVIHIRDAFQPGAMFYR